MSLEHDFQYALGNLLKHCVNIGRVDLALDFDRASTMVEKWDVVETIAVATKFYYKNPNIQISTPTPQQLHDKITMENKPTSLKPFDLEKALSGATVVTSNGESVKIAGHNPELGVVAGWVGKTLVQWNQKGNRMLDNVSGEWHQLFMAPVKRTVWVNVYKSNRYETETEAIPYNEEAAADHAHNAQVEIGRNRLGNKAHAIEIED